MSSVVENLKAEIKQSTAITNARTLVEKLNEHCFERCVSSPGATLSSSETACHSRCVTKYMAAWNAASMAVVAKMQADGHGLD